MPDRPLTAVCSVDALAVLIELLAERACVVVLLAADHVPACVWEGPTGCRWGWGWGGGGVGGGGWRGVR